MIITGVTSVRRVLFLSFSMLLAASCASTVPAYDPANYTPLPPLAGTVCEADMKVSLGKTECDKRLDVFVKRGLASSVKVLPANYSAGKAAGQEIGTGVLISKSGYVVTANHVLKGSKHAFVLVRQVGGLAMFPQYEDRGSVMMEVVRTDEKKDLALLRPIEPNTFDVFVDLASAVDFPSGARAWHFGRISLALAGPTYAIDSDQMKTPLKDIEGLTALATKAQQGDSGAGVLALNGKLVGILVGGAEGSLPDNKGTTFGLFVPIDVVSEALRLDTLPDVWSAPVKEAR